MAKPNFLPIVNRIESGTYLLYDGACGTGENADESDEYDEKVREEAET
jgi:type I restriction enzyme M protein